MTVEPFNLFSFKGKMGTLHLSWSAFFITFVVWFNAAPLLPAIATSLGVSTADLIVLATVNVAIAVPARVIIGMLTDRYGPRRTFALLLIFGALPCFWFALADSLAEAALARFFCGAVGAGFVVGIRLVSEWFPSNELGTAEGIYGGWGNFGSAAAAFTLPAIALWVGGDDGWRWAVGFTGLLSLVYGVVFYALARDTPQGATYYKPKHLGAMEVTSVGDLFLLCVMKLPLYLCLVLLAWRLSPAGFGLLGTTATHAIHAGIFALLLTDLHQAWRTNRGLLHTPVPAIHRYKFRQVAILNLLYLATFGSELAVISILPLFFLQTFELSPVAAGMVASSYAFMNLMSRPAGGWLSDRFGRKKTLLVLTLGLALGYLATSYIDSTWSVLAATLVVMCCSFFVQSGEGAVFAAVPLIKRRLTGQIAGMTGAYGNVGAVIYLLVLTYVDYSTFFLVIAITAFLGFLILFFMNEPEGQIAEINEDGSLALIQVG